ncbi:hypothetical protein CR194_12130 [Salipaludibacillus keqinensis]|uniref:DUF2254 domain-containing protein n=1 Tax=Salipaludibacillus keqinensis TaxID=2045207 RepID=A0A323TGI2_9BACI|nr:DUF2254 domain-containing protein [Salipaludibacillus keqinensis]PYZ93879.1 hypothetical protein CR194_12130 [Salipaludibacillus keqinensis]
MKISKWLPRSLLKYRSLSTHQLRYEVRSNLIFICLLYGLIGFILTGVAYWLDMRMFIGEEVTSFFQVDYDLTQQIIGTLIAGIITLNAFTLNSILVVLTNFSGQFTPRMLSTFISDKRTQHCIGIFNLVFVFILFSFFIIDESVISVYFTFPILTILFMFGALATFVYFINHAVKWMQVPTIMQNMKMESTKHILTTLVEDLERYRTREPNSAEIEVNEEEGHKVRAKTSGFLQIVDYKRLIAYAKEEDLLMRFEKRVGEYVLEGTELITYWKRVGKEVDEDPIKRRIFIGMKKTEVQDIEFGVNKLKEIAIKSIGNNDPNSASNAIYQLGDLLLSISKITNFTPYLTDKDNTLRVIIKKESFEYYLNSTFSHLTIYANEDPVITNDILATLSLLVDVIGTEYHKDLWEFSLLVAKGYSAPFSLSYNEEKFYNSLQRISETTGNKQAYEDFVKSYSGRTIDS